MCRTGTWFPCDPRQMCPPHIWPGNRANLQWQSKDISASSISPYSCMRIRKVGCICRPPVSQKFQVYLRLTWIGCRIGSPADPMDLHTVRVRVGIDQQLQLADNLLSPLGQCPTVKMQLFAKMGADALLQAGVDPCTKDSLPPHLPPHFPMSHADGARQSGQLEARHVPQNHAEVLLRGSIAAAHLLRNLLQLTDCAVTCTA